MPSLRGHHLICLHFFNGMGYDAQFVEELRKLLERAGREDIVIVTGPDDVCNRCPHLDGSRCAYTAEADEEITAMDGEALRLLGVSPGFSVSWLALRHLIPGVFSRWHEAYCVGCDWREACEESAWFKELHPDACEDDFPS